MSGAGMRARGHVDVARAGTYKSVDDIKTAWQNIKPLTSGDVAKKYVAAMAGCNITLQSSSGAAVTFYCFHHKDKGTPKCGASRQHARAWRAPTIKRRVRAPTMKRRVRAPTIKRRVRAPTIKRRVRAPTMKRRVRKEKGACSYYEEKGACSYHARCQLTGRSPACCQPVASLLPACCQPVASLLPACCQTIARLPAACCQPGASLLPAHCQVACRLLPAWCNPVARSLPEPPCDKLILERWLESHVCADGCAAALEPWLEQHAHADGCVCTMRCAQVRTCVVKQMTQAVTSS